MSIHFPFDPSITILVNKSHPLSRDDIPLDLIPVNVPFADDPADMRRYMRFPAAKALETLFRAAQESLHPLTAVSGYRSYDRQKEIYEANLKTMGKEHTLRYSAPPGTSEHQTGLAMDISSPFIGSQLTEEFARTPEYHWLLGHACLFGFIFRYPPEKESMTGYAWEPWHLRYVGPELARWMEENHLTLEEYYEKLKKSCTI